MEVKTLPFSAGSDSEIKQALASHRIGLTLEEARRVSSMLGRDPSIVEAVIWGIQGSEHCSYKSSRRFLRTFPTEGKHVILGPKEDSGIVAITDQPPGKRWGLVISHESHNHPSQIVPYEGAATGIGGVVRDVLCMGARIIGCLDALRLGDLQSEETRSIASEVIRGISGYGNPLGIPNLGGDTVFDASYNNNCLVNAIAIGLVREDEVIHSSAPAEAGTVGYDIVLIGKPTDRSGFGGAAFASVSMEEDKREQNTGAVQEPNPFLERHLLASFASLFDWFAATGNLGRLSCKDLGAGGVVCATVEQVSEVGMGATVDLDTVHVALPNLPPEVIACAETQERLCIVCHPDLTQHVVEHFNTTWDLPSIADGAGASVIGKVNTSGIYTLMHRGTIVCQAKAVDITCGLLYNRPTTPTIVERKEPEISMQPSLFSIRTQKAPAPLAVMDIFRAMLRHPNGASKHSIFIHYDKNVIGNTLIEPGEADAGLTAPLQDLESYVHEGTHPGWDLPTSEQWTGVAIAADGNGRYGRISPYWQGANAAIETMRNVAAVGATPRALTDCLNYGNPEIPEQLWALEEGVRGIGDAARGVRIDGMDVPIISGNVSLYNSKPDGSAIDPTAIVSCIGVMPDARKAITMQLNHVGSRLYIVRKRHDECGGSHYYQVLEELLRAPRDSFLGSNVPKPDFAEVRREIVFIRTAIEQELLLSCHDISEGGLLMALFEMTLPQRGMHRSIGIRADLAPLGSIDCADRLLFSESGGFVFEVQGDHEQALNALAQEHGVSLIPLGHTLKEDRLILSFGDLPAVQAELAPLREIWEKGLKNAMAI